MKLALFAVGAFGWLLLATVQPTTKPEYGFSRTKRPFRWADNTPADCPFPKSARFGSVLFSGRYANYTNADTWYPSWADDDALYSPWTDGYILRTDVFEPFQESHPGLACNSLDFFSGVSAAFDQAANSGSSGQGYGLVTEQGVEGIAEVVNGGLRTLPPQRQVAVVDGSLVGHRPVLVEHDYFRCGGYTELPNPPLFWVGLARCR